MPFAKRNSLILTSVRRALAVIERLPTPLVLFFVLYASPATYAQNPDKPPSPVPAATTITATPNPVTSEAGKLGTTKITWKTGDGLWAQVYVSENGKPEVLFNQGAEGAAEAPWIGEGMYKFLLYAGTEHKRLLGAVKVTHEDKSVASMVSKNVISAIWLAPLLSIVLLSMGSYLAFKSDHAEISRVIVTQEADPKTDADQSHHESMIPQRAQSRIPLRMPVASLIVSTAALGFMVVATWNVALPGLYYDELITTVPSLDFAKGPFPSAVSWVPESQVWIHGHSIPLMIMSYIGAVKTIIYVPVATLFGFTPESLRYFAIIIAALSLVTTFAFAKRLFDPAVAAATIVLLASDPSFIFYSRTDLGPFVLMMLLKTVALWQLTVWWKTGRNTPLFVGFLALGIGVYDKADFIWVIGAVIIAALIVSPYGLAGRLSAKRIGFAGLGLLAGAMPLVWFNLSWPPRTLAALFSPATEGGPGGGSAVQLVQRAGVLIDLLDGRDVAQLVGRDRWFPPILPFLVGVAAIFIIVQCLRRSTRSAAGPAAYVLLCGLLILGAAAVTRGGYKGWHVILVYPFPHLALAYVLIQTANKVRRWWPYRSPLLYRALLPGLMIIPLATNGSSVAAIYDTLQKTGGYGNYISSE
jgi:hypothetical protein